MRGDPERAKARHRSPEAMHLGRCRCRACLDRQNAAIVDYRRRELVEATSERCVQLWEEAGKP